MHVTPRAVFAVVLWAAALVPPTLFLIHLQSPVAAVQVAHTGATVLGMVAWVAAGTAALGALLYPPFMPAVRLGIARLRGRIGTDLAPFHEAKERLRHLETAADHHTIGRILLRQGRYAESHRHLRRAVELDPEHRGSRAQLGLALAQIGDLAGAVRELDRVVTAEPGHRFGSTLLELGVVLERAGANAQAIAILERHEQQFGAHPRALFHRARARLRSGDRERGLADLRAAAAPPEPGRHVPAEEALLRARARVAQWSGGRL